MRLASPSDEFDPHRATESASCYDCHNNIVVGISFVCRAHFACMFRRMTAAAAAAEMHTETLTVL